MKKRLLALALCLVLATSLLPVSAAAHEHPSWDVARSWVHGIQEGGTYCTDTYFTLNVPDEYASDPERIDPHFIFRDISTPEMKPDKNNGYTLRAGMGCVEFQFTAVGVDGGTATYSITVYMRKGHDWGNWISNGDGTHSRSCTYRSTCEGYETEDCADTSPADCKCDTCGAAMHTWQFKAEGNTLTATCGSCNEKVSVSLVADSVTLPDSPFNARLAGWEAFQKAVPTVHYEKLVYQFNGPSGWTEVEPTAANAKAGEYQVGVRIMGLPNKEYRPVARSLADGANGVGTDYADLYLKYTAVDPAITAQTGDNRPIEIMMASVLVFTALAAAAFVLDNKRKYPQ